MDNKKSTITDHLEDGFSHGQYAPVISYDNKGISGIIRSPYVFGAALLASFGGFSFGYDQGVVSLILTLPQFHQQFPEIAPGHPRYGFNTGFMTGMLEFGAFVGCIFFPLLADRYSRIWGLAVATVFFCVGAIIQTASHNYGTLVAGRTIGGIGVGTLAMGAPLYISEIAPPNLRGSLLVLEAISMVVGAIIAYWITYGTREIASDWSFRLPFILQMVPALVVGIGIQFFPCSPRWLAMRHRDEDSLQSLERLRRLPRTDGRVQQEWKGILREVELQELVLHREHGAHTNFVVLEFKQWGDLFKPKYLRRTTVALAIPFFQQFSGINAFVYYAPIFFAALGQSYEMSLILSGMVNICQFVAGIPTFLFLDKMGRRKLAIFGGIAMGIPHIIMAGVVSKYNKWESSPGIGWFGVALIYIYVLAYASSYGPLAWTLPAEIFPSSKRAKGVGAATAMVWLANFIIGVIVPEMQLKLGWGTYLFFGCFCFAASIFSFFFVPETAGKSLEQIAGIFGDSLEDEERELETHAAEEA
ncbi:hypothetical protein Daus18300_006848 [Diaporthe australafricana]|uniref:Major facilitator superfamily (MFS) profile domain-containing protein n=1 Tax=Diaporthe australafricana TaxID=127596 RepID=A0ABR3WRA8_9PEZI